MRRLATVMRCSGPRLIRVRFSLTNGMGWVLGMMAERGSREEIVDIYKCLQIDGERSECARVRKRETKRDLEKELIESDREMKR